MKVSLGTIAGRDHLCGLRNTDSAKILQTNQK